MKTGYKLSAEVVEDEYNYAYVCVSTTWKGKESPENIFSGEMIEVMWVSSNFYGVVGSQVADFIECYGVNSSQQYGVFTKRCIANRLIEEFSGLAIKEIIWRQNPLEQKLANGKNRAKPPKWVPKEKLDLVLLFSPNIIYINEEKQVKTDFYTVLAPDNVQKNWLLCNEITARKLEEKNYKHLSVKYIEIGRVLK